MEASLEAAEAGERIREAIEEHRTRSEQGIHDEQRARDEQFRRLAAVHRLQPRRNGAPEVQDHRGNRCALPSHRRAAAAPAGQTRARDCCWAAADGFGSPRILLQVVPSRTEYRLATTNARDLEQLAVSGAYFGDGERPFQCSPSAEIHNSTRLSELAE